MDNFDALKAATLGAQQIQAPQDNPLGASNADAVGKYYQSTFQLPQSQAASQAMSASADDAVAAQKRAAAAAKAKADDVSDPSKYRAVKKADGGFDWFDPDGKQIDIATLTQKTQTKVSDWIAGKYGESENPIDTQYIADKQNLDDLVHAVQSKDQDAIKKFQQSFKDNGLPDITKQTPQVIYDQFHKYYERYFVPRSDNPNAWGTTPNTNPYVPAPTSSRLSGGGKIGE